MNPLSSVSVCVSLCVCVCVCLVRGCVLHVTKTEQSVTCERLMLHQNVSRLVIKEIALNDSVTITIFAETFTLAKAALVTFGNSVEHCKQRLLDFICS